jgi:hypothetical protein
MVIWPMLQLFGLFLWPLGIHIFVDLVYFTGIGMFYQEKSGNVGRGNGCTAIEGTEIHILKSAS